ncbi:hypothetical protein QTG54_002576 [Skeletonema marinoi]|uniref:MYND-type domain-containing protein n=1 Tax=Skeletonema marinoi TaxID=267567 RepID=A0AAD8YL16_9STRA|nr:hypothetical protein QTG54_002576 [Skeletonema marinoi]
MSADTGAGEENTSCCASCGNAEVDDIKLKDCNDCKSVRYCGDKCQREHRTEPSARFNIICNGCDYANLIRELKGSLELKCAFCRHPRISDEELELNLMKRVEANDSAAMCQIGGYRRNEGDYVTAFQHYSKAAELGDAHAHYLLTQMYYNGEGVKKDEKKEVYHLAAIGGNPDARYDLGIAEWHKCRHARAVKHFIIAAKLALKDCYRKGLVSKEDFAAALRGHQAADDATKSPQREEAVLELPKLDAAMDAGICNEECQCCH